MHLAVELIAAEDGRVEGSVTSNGGREQATFSGWLELLRLLETAIGAPPCLPGASRPSVLPGSQPKPRSTDPAGLR